MRDFCPCWLSLSVTGSCAPATWMPTSWRKHSAGGFDVDRQWRQLRQCWWILAFLADEHVWTHIFVKCSCPVINGLILMILVFTVRHSSAEDWGLSAAFWGSGFERFRTAQGLFAQWFLDSLTWRPSGCTTLEMARSGVKTTELPCRKVCYKYTI